MDPPGLRFGSLLALKMAETSFGNPLGSAKSRPRGLFIGPRAVQERSKGPPRPPQEASMRPRRSKKGPRGLWGPIFISPGPLGASKTATLDMNSMLPKSPGNLPGALYKTSNISSRYSKTSLLCQEFSQIFQNKPPWASLLERKPRVLQERIPRRARARLGGVNGGASPSTS